MRGLVLVFFTALSVFAMQCHAATLSIPGKYTTIQTAIDAAKPGDTVSVGEGSFSEYLRIRQGVTLSGAGNGKTFVKGEVSDKALLSVEGCDGVTISGLTFEHDGVLPEFVMEKVAPIENTIVNICLVHVSDSSIQLENCGFNNSPGNGLILQTNRPSVVDVCTADGNTMYGIRVTSEGVEHIIKNCSFRKNGYGGTRFYCGPGPCGVIENNICDGNGAGICTSGSMSTLVIRKNTCKTSGFAGIMIEGGSIAECVENDCSGNGINGVWIRGMDTRAHLVKNTVSGNSCFGVFYEVNSGGSLEDNTVEWNYGSGVCLDREVSMNEVKNNRCENNKDFGIQVPDGMSLNLDSNPILHNFRPEEYRIRQMVAKNDFAGLDSMAKEIRDKGLLDPGGWYNIFLFYEYVSKGWGAVTKDNREAYLDFLKRWRKASPDSITPLAASMDILVTYAGDERGGGFANRVTGKQWKGFQGYLDMAEDIAEAGLTIKEIDPIFQSNLSSWYLYEGEYAKCVKAAAKGFSVAPLCKPLMSPPFNAALPRWGGKNDLSDMKKCCDYIVSLHPGEQQDMAYSMCVYEMSRFGEDLEHVGIDWERVDKGNRQYLDFIADDDLILVAWLKSLHARASKKEIRAIFDEYAPTEEKAAALSQDLNDSHYMRYMYRWAKAEGDTPIPPDYTPFDEVIEYGDTRELNRLLARGADPNCQTMYGLTPLHKAVMNDNIEAARLLLEKCADPNIQRGVKGSILCSAVLTGDRAMVELLLQHGADPDGRQPEGATPLIIAVSKRNMDIARLLLDNKANPSLVAAFKTSALHHAVRMDYIPMIQLLAEHGADVNTVGSELNLTPLDMAVAHNMIQAADALLKAGAQITIKDPLVTKRSALHWAVIQGSPETLTFLMESGDADPTSPDGLGDTPLHTAIRLKKLDMVDVLLKHGAPVDVKNLPGVTPLERARAMGFNEAVTMMEAVGKA